MVSLKFSVIILFLHIPHSLQVELCANPGWSENGALSKNQTTYSQSDKIYFFCAQFYTNIDKNYAVCSNGQWDETPSPCVYDVAYGGLATVEVVRQTENGESETLRQSLLAENRLTDENFDTCIDVNRCNETKVFIDLNANYNIHGVKIRFNGINMPTDVEIKVGRTFEGRQSEETCGRIYGTISHRGVIVKCQKPISGSSIIIYDYKTSGVLSLCDVSAFERPEIKGCGQPPAILFGQVESGAEAATYECDDGYQLIGQKRLECSQGKWTGKVPVCRQSSILLSNLRHRPKHNHGRSCDHPTHLSHANITLLDGTLTSGSLVQYECLNGLGQGTIRCLEDGSWSEAELECIPVVGEELLDGIVKDALLHPVLLGLLLFFVFLVVGVIAAVVIMRKRVKAQIPWRFYGKLSSSGNKLLV